MRGFSYQLPLVLRHTAQKRGISGQCPSPPKIPLSSSGMTNVQETIGSSIRKKTLFFLKLIILSIYVLSPTHAHAETIGMKGAEAIRQCVMKNDIELCHASITVASYPILDKFFGYGLMPCLPTNFTYESEATSDSNTTVTALLPDNGNNYKFRMIFVNSNGKALLDLPQTLRAGLGPKWQDKLNFSEQLFLLMRQNMQDKMTCEVLHDLASPQKGKM